MLKLLAADDEQLALLALKKKIQELIPQIDVVRTAKNGQEAVELAGVLRPDIAILDIEMPVLSGLDAANIIHKQIPDCRILFLTAYSKFEYAVGAIRVNASDYLVKPVSPYELRDKLATICKELAPEGQATHAVDASPFRIKVDTYLSTHYQDNISLELVAESLGQSPFYFSRCFKQEYGRNFIDYLTNYRLEHAQRLLLETELSVREIGQMCGYPDPNYFAKVFKRNRQVTPTIYRQIHQK